MPMALNSVMSAPCGPGGFRGDELRERPYARPVAVAEALAEFGAERLHGLDHVDRDQIDALEDILREFLAFGRDGADRVEMRAFGQHARGDDRFARAGDHGDDRRVLHRVFGGGRFDERDRGKQFLQLGNEGAAVLRGRD